MNRFVTAAIAALALLAIVAAPIGCTSWPTDQELEQGLKEVDAAIEQEQDANRQLIAEIKAELDRLPEDDPARPLLEESVAALEAGLDRVDQVGNAAGALGDSIGRGEVTPELRDALALLPYGSYIALALSVGFAVRKRMQHQRTLEDLQSIVASMEGPMETLTEEQRAAIRAIQGDRATAAVKEAQARNVKATPKVVPPATV